MSSAESPSRVPHSVSVEAGKTYMWCACGRSATQPWCDGSHRGTGVTPIAWTARDSGRVWMCGCKRTGRAPLCDGSHNRD